MKIKISQNQNPSIRRTVGLLLWRI